MKVTNEIKQEIIELVKLNGINDPTDRRINDIVDRFPDQYNNDQTLVEFHSVVGGIIEELKAHA